MKIVSYVIGIGWDFQPIVCNHYLYSTNIEHYIDYNDLKYSRYYPKRTKIQNKNNLFRNNID